MPALSIVGLAVLLVFAGLLAAAAIEDMRRLTISNRVSAAIALIFPAYALSAPAPVDWLTSLLIAAVSFAVGFGLFLLRVAGGGDVKLFAAASLWAGPELFPTFLLVTAMTGAVMAVAVLAARRLRPHVAAPADAAGAPAQSPAAPPRAELPYGVAIATGGLAVVVMHLMGA